MYSVLVRAVAFVILITAGGCTRHEPNSPEAGTITVYTARHSDRLAHDLATFRATYPKIDVTVVTEASSDTLVKRLYAERNTLQADVMWGVSATFLMLLEWHGMLRPYAPKGLADVPPLFRDTHTPPYWVGMQVRMSAFCVNSDALKNKTAKRDADVPLSWQDLIKPDYRGHIVMPNPTVSKIGYLVMAAILHHLGEAKGWVFLDALHQNIAQYLPSSEKPCQLAASGDVPIGISYGGAGIAIIENHQEAPIDIVFPAEGAAWDIAASALLKTPRIKPAAMTFLDWTLSARAMRVDWKYHAVTAMKTDVPHPKGVPEAAAERRFGTDVPWASANRRRLLHEWQKRYSNKASPTS